MVGISPGECYIFLYAAYFLITLGYERLSVIHLFLNKAEVVQSIAVLAFCGRENFVYLGYFFFEACFLVLFRLEALRRKTPHRNDGEDKDNDYEESILH